MLSNQSSSGEVTAIGGSISESPVTGLPSPLPQAPPSVHHVPLDLDGIKNTSPFRKRYAPDRPSEERKIQSRSLAGGSASERDILEDTLHVIMGNPGTFVDLQGQLRFFCGEDTTSDYGDVQTQLMLDINREIQYVHLNMGPDNLAFNVVKELLPLATYYNVMEQFCTSYSAFEKGKVVNALVSAYSMLIDDFFTTIVRCETRLRNSPTYGAHDLYHQMHPWLAVMSTAAFFALEVHHRKLDSISILNALWSNSKQYTGDHAIGQLYKFLLATALQPFKRDIESATLLQLKSVGFGTDHGKMPAFLSGTVLEMVKRTKNYWDIVEEVERRNPQKRSQFKNGAGDLVGMPSAIWYQAFNAREKAARIDHRYLQRAMAEIEDSITRGYNSANKAVLSLLQTRFELSLYVKSLLRFTCGYGSDWLERFLDLAWSDLALSPDRMNLERLETLLDIVLEQEFGSVLGKITARVDGANPIGTLINASDDVEILTDTPRQRLLLNQTLPTAARATPSRRQLEHASHSDSQMPPPSPALSASGSSTHTDSSRRPPQWGWEAIAYRLPEQEPFQVVVDSTTREQLERLCRVLCLHKAVERQVRAQWLIRRRESLRQKSPTVPQAKGGIRRSKSASQSWPRRASISPIHSRPPLPSTMDPDEPMSSDNDPVPSSPSPSPGPLETPSRMGSAPGHTVSDAPDDAHLQHFLYFQMLTFLNAIGSYWTVDVIPPLAVALEKTIDENDSVHGIREAISQFHADVFAQCFIVNNRLLRLYHKLLLSCSRATRISNQQLRQYESRSKSSTHGSWARVISIWKHYAKRFIQQLRFVASEQEPKLRCLADRIDVAGFYDK